MWSSDSDLDESVSTTTTTPSSLSSASSFLQPQTPPPPPPRRRRHRTRRRAPRRISGSGVEAEDSEPEVEAGAEAEEVWRGAQWEAAWPRQARPVVLAGEEVGSPDGTGAGAGEGSVGRARSLTDDDLEELKGCVDLGFGFSYDEIPELCGTLPALELCYSMSQHFLDEHQSPANPEELASEPPAVLPASPVQPIPNWKISSPGDSPEEVKARLKYWAQAVACTVKLCS